ncbi:hypothetical protein D920_02447 [Enterococcus faecalis 13-SD-W-01]|nr:hypothetical protein D920_02447 [Enterococcus faecalis 13-SD-W-01]
MVILVLSYYFCYSKSTFLLKLTQKNCDKHHSDKITLSTIFSFFAPKPSFVSHDDLRKKLRYIQCLLSERNVCRRFLII